MVELTERTLVKAPIERCFDLARSVEVHLAGNVHWGERAVAVGGVTSGLIGPGERVTRRAKHFGVWHELSSEITAMSRPIYFQDAMVFPDATHGPFRLMRHDHFFRAKSAVETEMRTYLFSPRRYMQSLLRERNAVLKEIAEHADRHPWR